MTRVWQLALVAVAALAVSGCAQMAAGRPVPASRTAAGPPSSAAPVIAAIDPCNLLTPAEAAEIGVSSQGKQEAIAGVKTCGYDGTAGFVLGINLDPHNRVEDLRVDPHATVVPLTVGNHSGRRLENNSPGFCSIEWDLTDSSSAEMQVGSISNNTPMACAIAMKVAVIVEPKLP